MKTTESIILLAACLAALTVTLAAQGQSPKPAVPPVKWYGEVQIDFRRGIPDELSVVDIQDGGSIAKRAEARIVSAATLAVGNDWRDAAMRICKSLVVSGTDRKPGDDLQVVLRAEVGRNSTSPGPLKPGRYVVVGMRPRNGLLPDSNIISDGTRLVRAESSDEVFALVIFPTSASAVSTTSDPVERIMESLVQALPGASRTNMERITSFLSDSRLPADDLSATVRTKTPVGWEKTLHDLVLESKDPYFRANGLEALMWHRVENIEGEFATALMDCSGDPDAFAPGPDYRGLGAGFNDMGGHAQDLGDRNYWDRSPFDHSRATQVALYAKNDWIRYYLINHVVYPPSPADWAEFVKLLRQPPAHYWQDMLVRAFARWRGDKPTPKIEYGLVNGRRQIVNMDDLVQFYSQEYLSTPP